MLTKKSAVLAILALVTLVSGVASSSSLLVISSIPIFSYLAFSLVYALNYSVLDTLSFERNLDKETAYEDESATVTIVVTNGGKRKIDYLEISDTVPGNLVVAEGSNHHVISLGGGERFMARYVVKPKVYGSYTLGPLVVKASDTLGTKTLTRVFQEVQNSLRVLPKVGYIGRINIRPKKTRNWPGEIVAKKVGSGMEFYSLRDYSPEDPIRRINWKATSKADERIYTNQFMSELGGDTILVLDARKDSEVGAPTESTVTYSIRAAAIIAYRLLRDRNRVGMVSLGASLQKVFPGFGKRQFDRIQLALSEVRSGSTWDMRGIGFFLSLFFSTMVQIVVISSLQDKTSFDAVFDIARRGYRVLVVSPSPIEIQEREIARKGDAKNFDLALRLLRVQRQNRLRELKEIASVADWNVRGPLTEALREVTYQWNYNNKRA